MLSGDARPVGRNTGLLVAGWGLSVTAGLSLLALCVALLPVVPLVVSSVTAVWSVILITFVSTALWRTPYRAVGLTLVAGAALLVPAEMFLARTAVDVQQFDVLESVLKDLVPESGGAGWLGFIAAAIARLPLLTSAMLALGLPLLIVDRWRRKLTLSVPALGVSLLLLGSSLLIPRVMRLASLFSPTTLPIVSRSAETMSFRVPPPPPPPPPPPESRADATAPLVPVRVGGSVQAPRKVKDVAVVYPAPARATGIEGVVILEITISPEGKVADARVLRSSPLLDQSALDAVKQWEFAPTTIDGKPVSLVMTVTVNFQL